MHRSLLWWTQWPLLSLAALLVSACSAPQDAASALAAQGVWLGDVRDGMTSSQEITAKLGAPTETYAGGKIHVYRLLHEGGSLAAAVSGDPRLYFQGSAPQVMHGGSPVNERALANHSEWDFVAVFDARGFLSRHRMLPVVVAWVLRHRAVAAAPGPAHPPASRGAGAGN